jgi:glutaredoxin
MKTLATSTTCGPCIALKSKIKSLGLEVAIKEHSPESDTETIEWFRKHNIRSVPKLVIEEGDTVEIVEGMDEIIKRLEE